VCQWKNNKNSSIIGEDIDKSKVPRFLWLTVYFQLCVSEFVAGGGASHTVVCGWRFVCLHSNKFKNYTDVFTARTITV